MQTQNKDNDPKADSNSFLNKGTEENIDRKITSGSINKD